MGVDRILAGVGVGGSQGLLHPCHWRRFFFVENLTYKLCILKSECDSGKSAVLRERCLAGSVFSCTGLEAGPQKTAHVAYFRIFNFHPLFQTPNLPLCADTHDYMVFSG